MYLDQLRQIPDSSRGFAFWRRAAAREIGRIDVPQRELARGAAASFLAPGLFSGSEWRRCSFRRGARRGRSVLYEAYTGQRLSWRQ